METEGPIKQASEQVTRIVEKLVTDSENQFDGIHDPEGPLCNFQWDWNVWTELYPDEDGGEKLEFWEAIKEYLFSCKKPFLLYVRLNEIAGFDVIEFLIDATEEELLAAYPESDAS